MVKKVRERRSYSCSGGSGGVEAWVMCCSRSCGGSLCTGVVFTGQSVTVGVCVFTGEGTVAVSSGVVPGGTSFSMGCSNIDTFGLDSGHRFECDLSQRVGLHMGCAWVIGCLGTYLS